MFKNECALGLLASAIVGGAAAPAVIADVVTIGSAQDNTLYEDEFGGRSNGAGQFMFVGRTLQPELRRALVAFDVAGAVPAGALIVDVELELYMSRTISAGNDCDLHRVTSDWGEGASDANGAEGGGAPAEQDDATWLHTFFDTDLWANEGGDFVATSSGTTFVGSSDGLYQWSGPGMVADVQDWLDNPGDNFGWILIGDEQTEPSAYRFNTREHPNTDRRPKLTITYFTDGETILPSDFEVTRGDYISGDLDDLFASDDSRVVVNAVRPSELAASSVEITVTGTASQDDPQALMFSVEGLTSGFPTFQDIHLFNFETSQWVLVDRRAGPFSETTVNVVVTENPGRFIQNGTREVRARMGYLDLGVTFIGWGGSYDLMNWTLFP